MENFNKNWLAIILIVIVFFMLGFLMGRVTGNRGGEKMLRERIIKGGLGGEELLEGDEDNITVKIDTLKNDGKQMEIRVEKKLKP
jgi:hypothetical protein